MQQLVRIKGNKVEWNERAQEAFECIKRELCEAPVLGIPTEHGMYVLDTDASDTDASDTDVLDTDASVVANSGILHQK